MYIYKFLLHVLQPKFRPPPPIPPMLKRYNMTHLSLRDHSTAADRASVVYFTLRIAVGVRITSTFTPHTVVKNLIVSNIHTANNN